jgi:hypothetical protein
MTITLAPLRRITPKPIRAAYRSVKRTAFRFTPYGTRRREIEPYNTVDDLFASLARHRDAEQELARLQGLRPHQLVRLLPPARGKGRHVRHNIISNRQWAVQWVAILCAVIPLAALSGAMLGMLFWVF